MILALAGGVGGAKLAHGLQMVLPPGDLVCVVNTADDFEHYGLRVCPDLDTVTYTLSGRANPETGWGLADESWTFHSQLTELGEKPWFQLGDKDLATHAVRTARLLKGQTLSEVTQSLTAALGVATRIEPMSNENVRTFAITNEGALPFQEYFVGRRCEPVVSRLEYRGVDAANPSPGFLAALESPDLRAIILCPSNPYLSTAPILSLSGINKRIKEATAPVIAVSPIVGGAAVKGPAAKLMNEFGVEPSPSAVAAIYGDLLDGFVIDTVDEANKDAIPGPRVMVTDSIMQNDDDRARLAREVLELAAEL